MYHSYSYICDVCGDSRDLATNCDNGGRCYNCIDGTYRKSGESYDQEWVDEQKYNERMDREYEERHRYDR